MWNSFFGLICTIGFLCQVQTANSQDTTRHILQISSKFLEKVSSKAEDLGQKLDKKSSQALISLQKQESKIKKKLASLDSLKARELFSNSEQKYKDLKNKLQAKISLKQYIPSLDTLASSLKFLQNNPEFISQMKEGQKRLEDALGKIKELEGQFQKAEEIKNFLKDRKQFLKEQLSKFGFAREIKRLNKKVYYYNNQIKEYKALLKDHKKAEKKAIELLCSTKLFKDFMKRNSMLASIFRMPSGGASGQVTQNGFAGLQTRTQLNTYFLQAGLSSTNAISGFQQNLQHTQSGLTILRNKVRQITSSNGNNLEMPDFKPNSNKTKSFFQRLEYGTTIQSQKASGFFPSTSDLGLSIGYKLNDDRSIIGIGASYKIGLGSGWNKIKLTNEGIGIKSFVDWKIKGSFWISGGYEQNYRTVFNNIEQLKDLNAWQQSGLLGLSKVVSLKSKVLKKTKFQLLWDFLSYQQKPRTQAVLFRIGYSF